MSAELGEDGKKKGMGRAERHANPAWWLAAEQAVVKVAKLKPKLTTDDIITEMTGSGTSTHEMRALGPLMRNAAADGVIEKALELPVKCATRPNNHRRPLTVWKSRIFKGL